MSTSTKPAARNIVLNVPNQLTGLRLVLSVVLFCLIGLHYYWSAFVVFIVAASTDWLDGYYARKYGQVTVLGRILDPFVDKVIICGTFIYLAAEPGSGIRPWMAVVVTGRELLVTALRSFLEGEGADFSASMSGKLKMGFQCLAVGLSLYGLSLASGGAGTIQLARDVAIWSAVALTVYSGAIYVVSAVRLMRGK
jgi:CDP-diacylglycerol--glycerol-3-phosphate 3-phosphatidyltransferase